MANSRRPQRPSGKEKDDQFDLFIWAESLAAKLGATQEDVWKLSLAVNPAVLLGFLTGWIAVDEDSALRPALAYATLAVFTATCISWLVRGCRSRIKRKGVSIFFQAMSVVVSCLAIGFVIHANWQLDAAHLAQKKEEGAKAQAQQDASRAEQRRRMKERQREQEAARAAEQKCLKDRADAISRAERNRKSQRKSLEDCKMDYAKLILPFRSEAEQCKSAQAQFDKAKSQVWAANAKICDTGSLPNTK